MENRKILNRSENKKLNIENNKPGEFVLYIGIVVVAVLARLLPHLPNLTPITGLALFSGASSKNKGWLLVPLVAMFISDIFLGFHITMPFVYGSFFVITLFGSFINNSSRPKSLFIFSIFSSLFFFIVTNFGVWATSTMYTKNLQGLLSSYLMGIPFLKNAVLGDIIYTTTFFYGYRLFAYFILNKKAVTKA